MEEIKDFRRREITIYNKTEKGLQRPDFDYRPLCHKPREYAMFKESFKNNPRTILLMGVYDFYHKHYKKFIFVPFLVLIAAFVSIFLHVQQTGDYINKDISLKGGIVLTIQSESAVDISSLGSALVPVFAPNEVSIRLLDAAGRQIGFLVESDLQDISQEKIDEVLATVEQQIGKPLSKDDYSLETVGSALGASFFTQAMKALLLAFIFMGIVVLLYFRSFVPSTGVMLCALSDIVGTVAISNLLGIKFGTASIAALLMLVGYSIDTDILLTTRVLKRKDGTVREAVIGAFKTGMTMTLTSIAAVVIALIFTQSEVIRQIMTVLLIGLALDIIYTWAQNAGILLWYIERKNGNKEDTH